jgi:hypothetical protein
LVGCKNRGPAGADCAVYVFFGCWTNEATHPETFGVAAPSAATQQFYFCDTSPPKPFRTQSKPSSCLQPPAFPPCTCSQICGVRVLTHGLGPRELAHGIGGPGRCILRNQPRMGASIQVPRGILGGAQTGLRRYHLYLFLRSLRWFLPLGFRQAMLYIIQSRYIGRYITARVCLQPFAPDRLL